LDLNNDIRELLAFMLWYALKRCKSELGCDLNAY